MDRATDASLHRIKHPRSNRRGHWYLALGLILIITLIAASTSQPTLPASASADEEAQFVAALNQVRAGVGLPALTVNVELVALSRQHAQVMADAGHIFHASPISAGFTGSWAKLGENVGVGANVSVLVDAFVASPGHYANIVDPGFTQIGVGVVWSGNAMYTTHRFLQLPAVPATATAPPAAPATTTAPPAAPATTTASSTPVATLPLDAVPTPTTTTTTTTTPPVAALSPLQVQTERIVELVKMVELVGT